MDFTDFRTNSCESGGLDVIFGGERYYKISLESNTDGSPVKLRDLIKYIVDNMIKDEKDINVFLENGTMWVFLFSMKLCFKISINSVKQDVPVFWLWSTTRTGS